MLAAGDKNTLGIPSVLPQHGVTTGVFGTSGSASNGAMQVDGDSSDDGDTGSIDEGDTFPSDFMKRLLGDVADSIPVGVPNLGRSVIARPDGQGFQKSKGKKELAEIPDSVWYSAGCDRGYKVEHKRLGIIPDYWHPNREEVILKKDTLVCNSSIETYLKNPPPFIEKNYEPKEWPLVGEPMSERLVAQIRFAFGDDVEGSIIFRRNPLTGSYHVVGDADVLWLMTNAFQAVHNWWKDNGGKEDSTSKLNSQIIELTSIKNNVPPSFFEAFSQPEGMAIAANFAVMGIGIGGMASAALAIVKRKVILEFIKRLLKINGGPKGPTPTGGGGGGGDGSRVSTSDDGARRVVWVENRALDVKPALTPQLVLAAILGGVLMYYFKIPAEAFTTKGGFLMISPKPDPA